MPNSHGHLKTRPNRTPGSEPGDHAQRVVVIDDLDLWRGLVSTVLRNHDYCPMPYSDLSAATAALERWDTHLALAGICLEMNLGKQPPSSKAEATLPEIHLFLDLIRNRFRTVPILIMSLDEKGDEEGLRTAIELNNDGLRAAFIPKLKDNFIKNVSEYVGKVLGGKPIVGAGWTLSTLSSRQKSDLAIVFTLVCGLAFACLTGALSTWLLRRSGIVIIGPLLIFVTLIFSLGCLFVLGQTGALPANVLKQCMQILLRALGPQNVLKHFKRDGSLDDETK